MFNQYVFNNGKINLSAELVICFWAIFLFDIRNQMSSKFFYKIVFQFQRLYVNQVPPRWKYFFFSVFSYTFFTYIYVGFKIEIFRDSRKISIYIYIRLKALSWIVSKFQPLARLELVSFRDEIEISLDSREALEIYVTPRLCNCPFHVWRTRLFHRVVRHNCKRSGLATALVLRRLSPGLVYR